MSKEVPGNLAGPFSTPSKFEVPVLDGFIGVPRPSGTAEGWGEPYKTPEGVPITPGTPGGPNQAATLMKKKKEGSTWKLRRAKRIQKFGEISWRGEKKTEKEDAKRYILTYHGPSSRHFPTTFSYGTDSKHRNVYMEGGLMGIAPGPVLGACLQTISNKRYLTVVCLADEGEIVLRRPAGAPVYGGDEAKVAALADYATEKKPNGWVKVGTVNVGDGYERPKTPWFFNESGTEGQCIRIKEKDGTFNGDTKKEKAGDRFKLQTAGGGANLLALGNLPAYEFKESGKLTNNGMWTSPPDTQGYPHKWEEMNLKVKATCEGKQVVAVDYQGDTEVLIYCVVDVNYEMNQDYMCGKDEDLYGEIPLNQPPGYRNWINNPVGYRYMNPLKLGVDPTATVGNHEGFMWFGGYAWTYLSFTLEGTEHRISLEAAGTLTVEEFNDLPRNPENNNIFQRYYEIQYVRHLDIREGGMIVTRLDKFEEFPGDERASMSKEETVDTDFSDNSVWAYLEGDKEWNELFPMYHPRLNRTQDFKSEYANDYSIEATWEIVHGEGRPGTPGWVQTPWEWTATTWIGARPDNNDTATLGNLPINSWFPLQSDTYRKSWYGVKLLFHDLNQETACFCRREDKTYILSGELPHPNTGEPTPFIEVKPDDLKGKVDGAVYYPLGEL